MADRVARADGLIDRMVGLLGRKSLGHEEGLWLDPCSQVHTFFMKFSIDVVFLDSECKVVRILPDLVPWRVSPWVWGARSVLELAAGEVADKIKEGDVLEMIPNERN